MMKAKEQIYSMYKKYHKFVNTAGIVLGIAISILLIAIFYFNYKFPESDKHPDWPEFPEYTKNRIVVEQIDSFEKEYGIKSANIDSLQYTDYYKTNLRNITSLGYCILRNEFEYNGVFNLKGLGGGNGPNYNPNPPVEESNFHQEGYEYYQLKIKESSCFFKFEALVGNSSIKYFYQYNYPKSNNDTLLFNYLGTDYRAFVKKRQ